MRATFGKFDKWLFLKVHRYTILYDIISNCGSFIIFFFHYRGSFLKVQRYAIIWFLIFNCGPFIRVFLLFIRGTFPVFQFLLLDHIWLFSLLSGPILGSKAWVQFFQKRSRRCWKREKYFKSWAKMYKIWKYLE